MFGLIKKLVGFVFFLVVIAGVAIFLLASNFIGDGVTKVFNQMGPTITGTETYIESTGVNVLGGSIDIKGLFIGNPEGFSKPSAMQCDQIFVDIETSTLFSDEIVVNEIRIEKPNFTFEQTLLSNNLSKLKAQVDENTRKYKKDKPSEPAEEPVERAQKKTLRLNKLVVTDGQVDLAVLTVNRELPLPQIEKDFGGEGVTPAEAADYVLSVVIEKVVEVAINMAAEYSNDPNAAIQSLTGEDGAQTVEAIKGLFK